MTVPVARVAGSSILAMLLIPEVATDNAGANKLVGRLSNNATKAPVADVVICALKLTRVELAPTGFSGITHSVELAVSMPTRKVHSLIPFREMQSPKSAPGNAPRFLTISLTTCAVG